MIARLYVLLPFQVALQEGQKFPVYRYDDQGYGVCIYPPQRSKDVSTADGPDSVTVDGQSAFLASALWIDFHKESFERPAKRPEWPWCDPPFEVMNRAINSFIVRLRSITRASHAHPLDFPNAVFRLQYIEDDGSELGEQEDLIRELVSKVFRFSHIALTKQMWVDLHTLDVDYKPPRWESFLLDAKDQLPSIGPAVAVAATALEVFISYVLEELSVKKRAPKKLWKWINDRGDWRREPSLKERYDVLLEFLTDHSLKEEATLWESFKNLRDARNSFVHNGVAKIGGTAISVSKAGQLVRDASSIVSKVREWLPEEMQWPEFNYDVRVEAAKNFFPLQNPPDAGATS